MHSLFYIPAKLILYVEQHYNEFVCHSPSQTPNVLCPLKSKLISIHVCLRPHFLFRKSTRVSSCTRAWTSGGCFASWTVMMMTSSQSRHFRYYQLGCANGTCRISKGRMCESSNRKRRVNATIAYQNQVDLWITAGSQYVGIHRRVFIIYLN